MTAIIHKWLRIKSGTAFHARIGTRRTFACGKPFTKWFNLESGTQPRCKQCKSAMDFAEDMYGGAND